LAGFPGCETCGSVENLYNQCIFSWEGDMRLDKQTDYSLRVLMFLATNRDRLSTIAEIADRFDISQAHLMKVVHLLGRAGFVETVRGRSGGMRLAGDGTTIRVGDIVRRMESDLAPVECLRASGGNCLIAPCCRLKDVLSRAMAAYLAILDGATIADLVEDNDALALLLGGRAA
jgi:Rrf2 family transcriptional regulator, nitric oxide-sensitive transcriptional repressor